MEAVAPRWSSIPDHWRAVISAVSQSGAAAMAGAALNLAGTKLLAVSLGPSALSLYGTCQQLRQGAVTVGGLNGQVGLVQGTSSLDGLRRREFARTAIVLSTMATALVAATFICAPAQVADWAGLGRNRATLVRMLSPAVIAGVGYSLGVALLSAAGLIRQVAWIQVSGPAGMLLLAYPSVLLASAGYEHWATALIFGSALMALAAVYFAQRQTGLANWIRGEGRWWSGPDARRFLAISGALWASGVFATWVTLTIRARILRMDGLTTAGQFDAAWTLSMNQSGLVLASLQTYYLPALSKLRSEDRGAHIGRVLIVAAALAAGIVTVLAATKPVLLRVLYSDEFMGATKYLRWTLAGDYLKVTGWILSIPLVASAQMRLFLATDLAAYSTFGLTAWALTGLYTAAEAAAIGFVAMYLVHTILCGSCLWFKRSYRPDRGSAGVWFTGLGLVVAATSLFWRQA